MELLFVPGINTLPIFLWPLRWNMRNQAYFTDYRIRKDVYSYTQHKRCERIVQSIMEDIIEHKPTVILTHSFGGVLAKTAVSRLKEHSVEVFCTMASPHQYDGSGINATRAYLGTPNTLSNVQVLLSFGGTNDKIVRPEQSIMPNAVHINLAAKHSSFILNKAIINQVLLACSKDTTTYI